MSHNLAGLGVGTVFLILGLPSLLEALRTRRQLKLFQRTPKTRVDRIRNGLCRLSGRIESEEALLVSPMSRRRSVFCEIKVYTPKVSGDGRDIEIVHVHDRQCLPCYIDDGTGKVDLDLSAATRHFEVDRHEESGHGLFRKGALFGKKIAPELEKTLRRYGVNPRRGQVLHYEEIVIERGENLSVLGTAICEKGHRPAIIEQALHPFVVAESDDHLMRHLRADSGSGIGVCMVYWLIACLGFVLPIYSFTTATIASWAGNRIAAVQRSDNIDELVAHLQGDDPLFQVTAATRLNDFGTKARVAIPALEQMLRDEDTAVQGVAVAALGSIGKEAVPQLVRALQTDELSILHVAIAQELGKLGPDAQAALPALAAC